MEPRIEALVNRLAELPELEKELRREANGIVFPRRDASGTVTLEIIDEARYQAINEELESIAREKEATQDKVNRLAELLGDSLVIPSGDIGRDHVARLKVELGNHFFHKCLTENRTWLLPEEAINDPRYLEKKAKIMPQIEEAEGRVAEAEHKAERAYTILSGP